MPELTNEEWLKQAKYQRGLRDGKLYVFCADCEILWSRQDYTACPLCRLKETINTIQVSMKPGSPNVKDKEQ